MVPASSDLADVSSHADAAALPSRFDVLTSLRIVAAMAVLLFHCFHLAPDGHKFGGAAAVENRPIQDGLLAVAPWLSQGHLAVDFFFVLSGFVLAHVYLPRREAGRFSYLSFLRRRVARIYPLHLAMLAGFIGLIVASRVAGVGPADAKGYAMSSLPAHLTLSHAWGVEDTMSFNGPSWSVSAEWGAYLLFPLVAWALCRVRPAAGLVASVVWLIGCDWFFSTPDLPMTQRAVNFGILRIVAEFPLGVALWRLLRQHAASASLPTVGATTFWGGGAMAIVSASLGWAELVTVGSLAAVVFGAAALEHRGRLKWLAPQWMVYGGEISYSVYMVHALIQTVFAQVALRLPVPLSPGVVLDAAMAAAVVVTVIASMATHRWIEVPGRRFLNGRPSAKAAPATNTSATLVSS